MTDEEFAALVERDRIAAERDPEGYRRRVIGLIVLGYVCVFGIAAIFLGLAIGVITLAVALHLGWIAFKLAAPLLGLAFLALSSMWVTPPPPDGEAVGREDAPELFRMIDELRERVDAAELASVRVVSDLNAGVRTIAHAGLFGASHHLEIGLPLLQALTVEQWRAVLAHELGHLSRAHGRLGAFVYQARGMWTGLHATLVARRNWAQSMLTSFLGWYAPYFNAGTFVLARRNEYEADQISASATSPSVASAALARLALASSMLTERVMPGFFARARTEPLPAPGMLEYVGAALWSPLDDDTRRRWMDAAYARATGPTDTHPSLADRLAAFGVARIDDPPAPHTFESSAASLLGAAEPAIRHALERIWKGGVLGTWEQIHREEQRRQARARALVAMALTRPLTSEEALEQVVLTHGIDPPAEVRSRLEALLPTLPEHAPALFWTGRLRLETGDDAGIELVRRAMELDPDAIVPGGRLIASFLFAHGRAAEIPSLSEAAGRLVEAASGSCNLTPEDDFEPHGRSPAFLDRMHLALAEVESDVQIAYLVRRQPTEPAARTQLVLVIRPKASLLPSGQATRRERLEAWFRRLDFLPSPTFMAVIGIEQNRLRDAVEAVAGARVFGVRPAAQT